MAGPTACSMRVCELPRRLDVVGQHQDLLGKQAFLGVEEPFDALDDDARLARARTGDDHRRSVAMLDDQTLLGVSGGSWRSVAAGGLTTMALAP